MSSISSRWLENASDVYDRLTFVTNDIYNDKAPDPWVAFLIGGICCIAGFTLWIRRLIILKSSIGGTAFHGSVLFRAMISAAIDSDEPFYTISSFSAFSFVCLGGLQLNYEVTFAMMLVGFAISSLGDSIRVIVAYHDAASLADVVLTSNLLSSKLAKNSKRQVVVTTELSPSNVYEDFGRGSTIVLMVFATQVILISFVAVDIYESPTHSCPDGTAGCPTVGTLGSWVFYVLGIFMACVYLLGPKTNFGQSEQNPAYWLQLLLAAKTLGAHCSWYDAVADKERQQELRHSDWRIWGRFFMSFVINGFGFHILVHALPIQVATQSSLIGVVFRAVGMMYLVDLDDTPAEYTFRLAEKVEEDVNKSEEELRPVNDSMDNDDIMPSIKPPMAHPVMERPTTTNMSEAELSEAAQRIVTEALEDARIKLEALARGEGVGTTRPGNSSRTSSSSRIRKASSRKLMSGALIMASTPVQTAATIEALGALEEVEDVENDDDDDEGGSGGGEQSTIAVGNGTDSAPYSTINEVSSGNERDIEGQLEETASSNGPTVPPDVVLDPPSMPSIAEVPSAPSQHVTFAEEQPQHASAEPSVPVVQEQHQVEQQPPQPLNQANAREHQQHHLGSGE